MSSGILFDKIDTDSSVNSPGNYPNNPKTPIQETGGSDSTEPIESETTPKSSPKITPNNRKRKIEAKESESGAIKKNLARRKILDMAYHREWTKSDSGETKILKSTDESQSLDGEELPFSNLDFLGKIYLTKVF
eukprot:UN29197